MLEFGEYVLQDPLEPGDYRFVPPLEFVYRRAFGDSTPFAIGSGAEFLPSPPPLLTSWIYALSVNEVKAFGRLNSRFRSHDQTNLAACGLAADRARPLSPRRACRARCMYGGRHGSPKRVDRTHHLDLRQRRPVHLEGDSRHAAEHFTVPKDPADHLARADNQQRTAG
jgi:hypothetical protein